MNTTSSAPAVATGDPCPDGRQQRFDEILRLSRYMLEHAVTGNWAAVSEAETERQRLIGAFFGSPAGARDAAWLAAGIGEILQCDRRVMDLGKMAMDSLSAELRTFEVGRRAQAAYGGR